MEEYNEFHITKDTPDEKLDELIEFLEETTRLLDNQPSLEQKQEFAVLKLQKILDWQLEHGYLDSLFPIFEEFIQYLPEDKINSFLKTLLTYTVLHTE